MDLDFVFCTLYVQKYNILAFRWTTNNRYSDEQAAQQVNLERERVELWVILDNTEL